LSFQAGLRAFEPIYWMAQLGLAWKLELARLMRSIRCSY